MVLSGRVPDLHGIVYLRESFQINQPTPRPLLYGSRGEDHRRTRGLRKGVGGRAQTQVPRSTPEGHTVTIYWHGRSGDDPRYGYVSRPWTTPTDPETTYWSLGHNPKCPGSRRGQDLSVEILDLRCAPRLTKRVLVPVDPAVAPVQDDAPTRPPDENPTGGGGPLRNNERTRDI